MKKGFILIIGSFTLGLVLIISMVVWNLSSISSSIKKEAFESAAFYERNAMISEKMLQTSAYVERMFTVSSTSDVEILDKKTKEELLSVKTLLEGLKSDQFSAILSEKIVNTKNHLDGLRTCSQSF